MKLPGSGGSGQSMSVSFSEYITDSGVGILWGKLTTTLISAIFAAIALGYAGVINASVGAVLGLIDGVASFAPEWVAALFGLVIEPSAHAWALATGAVGGITSVWTPLLMLSIVVGYLYVVRWADG